MLTQVLNSQNGPCHSDLVSALCSDQPVVWTVLVMERLPMRLGDQAARTVPGPSPQQRTLMRSVHAYLQLWGPQKPIKPHLKHAAWSIPAFLLTVVTVRKPNCLEKHLLICYYNTPEARQYGHQPGSSQNVGAQGHWLLQSQVKKIASPAALFLDQRVKYR